MNSLSIRMAHAKTSQLQDVNVRHEVRHDASETFIMPDGSVITQKPSGVRRILNKACKMVEIIQVEIQP